MRINYRPTFERWTVPTWGWILGATMGEAEWRAMAVQRGWIDRLPPQNCDLNRRRN